MWAWAKVDFIRATILSPSSAGRARVAVGINVGVAGDLDFTGATVGACVELGAIGFLVEGICVGLGLACFTTRGACVGLGLA